MVTTPLARSRPLVRAAPGGVAVGVGGSGSDSPRRAARLAHAAINLAAVQDVIAVAVLVDNACLRSRRRCHRNTADEVARLGLDLARRQLASVGDEHRKLCAVPRADRLDGLPQTARRELRGEDNRARSDDRAVAVDGDVEPISGNARGEDGVSGVRHEHRCNTPLLLCLVQTNTVVHFVCCTDKTAAPSNP